MAINEIKCIDCGSNGFKLTRMLENQILLECLKCGHPHLLDSEADIEFWTEKKPD